MRSTLLILAFLACGWQSPTSQTTEEAMRPSTNDEIQDLVYLAPDRPMFMRFRISVLGQGFRAPRADYARRLLQSLDADGNGQLDAREMQNIPPAEEFLPPRGLLDKPRMPNSDPVDADASGVVTLEELINYVNKSTGTPFDFRMAPSDNSGSVDLFELIDVNGDGLLDEYEIGAAARAIAKLDANDDEIVDLGELSTNGALRTGGDRAKPEELLSRWIAVDRESVAAQDELCGKLIARYGKPRGSARSGNESTGERRVGAAELGVSPDQFTQWDANGDGALQAVEGRFFLLDPPVDLELSMPLGSAGRPTVGRFPAGANDTTRLSAAFDKRGTLQLAIVGERFDFVIGRTAASAGDVRRQYDRDFEAADADGNEYLGMAELRRLGLPESALSVIDRNGDGMVRKDEFLEYVELQRLLFSSRVALLLSRDALSILDLVDEDADGQLCLRELQQAPSLLLKWDVNGDGRIELGEFPANSRLILQNGETTLFWDRPRNGRREKVDRPPSGPVWFQKMDRNRDGDLSPREFLGPLSIFKRLDKNGDGLVSESETHEVD